MAQVTGVLQDIRSRNTSVGQMYDVVVDGNTYGNGKYAPRGISVGDTVSFDCEVRGNYKNVAKGTLRKVDAAAASPSTISGTAPLRDLPPTDAEKQTIISRQAAMNTAVAFVSALLGNECAPLPVKAADRLAYCNALVLAYADSFHTISTGKPLGAASDALDVSPVAARKTRAAAAAVPKAATTEDAADGDDFQDDDIPF